MNTDSKEMLYRPLPKNGYKLVPAEAKKVFTGVLFDVYQWQQEMFDGSHKTFEMLKRPDTVLAMVADDDDDVVVLCEEQPGLPVRPYRLPGGRVDPQFHSVLEAAKQELLEETGLTCARWRHVETVQPEKKIEWFIHVFLAENIVSEVAPTPDIDGERILEIKRMRYEEIRTNIVQTTRTSVFRRCETLADVREELDAQ